MKITVVAVGKIKEKFFADAVSEYRKRLGRYCKLEILQVADEKTPDGVSEALEKQIHALGLERDFKLLGAVDNPYPYYRGCDIYVHATRFEGKSIAVQEAQILGCAIVASDCNGNREQIENGVDGVLCGFSTAGISESIISLIEDRQKRERLAKAAAEKQLENGQEMQMFWDLLT